MVKYKIMHITTYSLITAAWSLALYILACDLYVYIFIFVFVWMYFAEPDRKSVV